MNLKFFEPPADLKPYVKIYLYYRMRSAGAPEPLKFIPSGSPFMVFNLSDPFTIQNHKHLKGLQEDGVFAVGQQEAYYLLKPGCHYVNFCVIFQPTGLSRLFNIPIHEILNDSIILELLIKQRLNNIVDLLRNNDSNPEYAVAEMNAFFYRQLLYHKPVYPYVEYSMEVIKQQKGLVSVSDLADLSNTCVRNYRRRFLEIAGISPKKYILITRLQHIMHTLTHDPLHVNWSDITFELGYYDQNHLIKAFKKFCGETPSEFVSTIVNPAKSHERSLNKVTT